MKLKPHILVLNPHPLPTLRPFLTLLCILLAAGCGKKEGGSTGSSGKLEPFPLAFYHQNPGGIQGNQYQLKAQIDRQLGWKQGVGRLLLVQASDESGTVQKVPVFIPDGTGTGVLPGQKFLMTVLVGTDNLVIVEQYEKY